MEEVKFKLVKNFLFENFIVRDLEEKPLKQLDFFFFKGPHLAAYEGSQARGRIGATAADLCYSHSNARSELHL